MDNDQSPYMQACLMNDLSMFRHSLPAEKQMEMMVLGCLVSEFFGSVARGQLVAMKPPLVASDFTLPPHQTIFTTVKAMIDRDEPVEIATVQCALDAAGKLEVCGGTGYLLDLQSSVGAPDNFGYYVSKVRDASERRALIVVARETIARALNAEITPQETVTRTQADLIAAMQPVGAKSFRLIREPLIEIWEQSELCAENGGMMTGLSSGFPAWDAMTNGLQDTDLIIVAARPSKGKTAFCLSISDYVAVALGKPVALVSLEMSSQQLARRMLCSRAEVDSNQFRSGRIDAESYFYMQAQRDALYSAPIYISERTSYTMAEMHADLLTLHSETNFGLVVVDYLQLVEASGRTQSREQEVAQVAKGLKKLARTLRVPVVALSQLSRKLEERANKRPMLSDLRESGSIEQEADMICFLHREDKEKGEQQIWTPESAIDAQASQTELIIAKHRNGPTGTVLLEWCAKFAKFSTYKEPEYEMGDF